MSFKLISIHHANDNKHKLVVKVKDANNGIHTIQFGAKGYSDFTMNKDLDRKDRYLARHAKKEDWTINGVLSAGFWSRWVLWNKPSLKASIKDVIDKFHL